MLCLIFILYIYIAYSFSLEIANLFRSCRFSHGIEYFLEREEEKILCCAWSSSCTFILHILLLLKSVSILPIFPWNQIFLGEGGRKNTVLRLIFILYIYIAYSPSLEIENLFRSYRFSRGKYIIYFLEKKEEKILCCALHLTPHILFLLKSQICFYLADFSVESDIFGKGKGREKEKILCCAWSSSSTFISHILLLLKSKICFDLADFSVELYILEEGRDEGIYINSLVTLRLMMRRFENRLHE